MSPCFKVCYPPGFEAERRYAIQVVFELFLGMSIQCVPHSEHNYTVTLGTDRHCVTLPDAFFSSAERHWLKRPHLPRVPLRVFNTDGTGHIHEEGLPVLFGVENGDSHSVPIDIIGSIFFLITRYEEIVIPDRDRHGRFPVASSVVREVAFDRPLVEEYLDLLKSVLLEAWPGILFPSSGYRVEVSHDVDFPFPAYGIGFGSLIRQSIHEARKFEFASLLRLWACQLRKAYDLDPGHNFPYLFSVLSRLGIHSTFFFFGRRGSHELDGNYSPDSPAIKALLRQVVERGHNIGLHGSYESFSNPELLRAELSELQNIISEIGLRQGAWASRQHFLRWQNPVTWQGLEAAGVSSDCTLGYAERIGFRAGTTRKYPAFNVLEGIPMKLEEKPLAIMDVTLVSSQYMNCSEPEAIANVISLRDACRRHEIPLSLLWHNTSLRTKGERRLFEAILENLLNC